MDADSVGIPVACEASSLPCHSFATHDLIASAQVPLCPPCTRAMGLFLRARVAHGSAVHARSPRGPGSASCQASLTDDQGAVSWSMDTGVSGLTFGLRVWSVLSVAGGSGEVTRSRVVFHFHFYFLLCYTGEERLCR